MKKVILISAILYFLLSTVSTVFAQKGWFPLHSITSPKMKDIYFINADTGFLATLDNGAFKTTNGGQTWDFIPNVFTVNHIRFFNHNKLGFIGDFQTNDSGRTWFQNTHILRDVCFPSDSIGYTIGLGNDTSSIILGKTTNGGKTWKYTNILPLPSTEVVDNADEIYFSNDKYGFVNEGIYNASQELDENFSFYTSDGGITWTQAFLYHQMLFLHDSTWLSSAGNDGSIYKTYDDFAHSLVVSDSGDCCPGWNLSKADTNTIYSFNFNTLDIHKSTDAGNTWHKQFRGEKWLAWVYGGISTPTPLVGYVVGIDSQIYKTIDGGSVTTEVKSEISNTPFDISPNPTTGIIAIHNTPANILHVTVSNLLGENVLELPHPNAPEFTLDLSKLPSGTYFARFALANEVVTRKILKE